jgi:adenine-specific DNA-methyltransferase
MKTNLFDNLKNLFQKDERLVSKGELLKNKIIELALKLDKDLIKLLLSNNEMKKEFFTDIDGTLIFDNDKFIRFVSNKQFLPDSYTSFKNKIGLIDEKGEFISEKKEVVLSWPYKDCVLEGGMTKEDQKRDEIFWNEILAPDEISRLLDPKVFTDAKRIDTKGEHKLDKFKTDENGNIKDNLIIKGNNLLALHSLKKRFAGRVKLIYIDPPYNTGNDSFKYNDAFNHSTWLTFMKNRLEVARDLLRNDGIIFIQIDSEERDYLKVLLDDIFGRENYLNNIVVRKKQAAGVGQDAFLLDTIEYILMYAKSKIEFIKYKQKQYLEFEFDDKLMDDYGQYVKNFGERIFVKTITDARGEEVKIYEYPNIVVEKVSDDNKEKNFYLENFDRFFVTYGPQSSLMKKVIKNLDDTGFYEIEYVPSRGLRNSEIVAVNFYKKRIVQWLKNIAYVKDNRIIKRQVAEVLWTDISWDVIGPEGGVELKSGKKPEELLKRIIEITTLEGDLVLDFFAGTGTTCAVAHKMGRQYIGVEQLDYGENSAVVRLKNVINGDPTGISKEVGWQGGSDFVYLELMKWNENFADEIQKAKTKDELQKLWETMKENAFLSYKVDIKTIDEHAKDFDDLSIEDQKRFLLECLDKNHLYVNYSEIDDEEYGVSEEDKKLNREFYGK